MRSDRRSQDMCSPASSPRDAVAKRLFDLTVVTALCGPILVVGTLVALWVKLTSRGPILFRQVRIGYRSHPIVIHKFRTMVENAETDSHRNHVHDLAKSGQPLIKLDGLNDPRLIPGARFLRGMGLDELPQVLNILRGDLSLVGPRPCLPEEYELFPPTQRARFEVLPGITGYWQVNGKNRTTFDEMVALDSHYARHHTRWLDAKILLQTPGALARQMLDSQMPPPETTAPPGPAPTTVRHRSPRCRPRSGPN